MAARAGDAVFNCSCHVRNSLRRSRRFSRASSTLSKAGDVALNCSCRVRDSLRLGRGCGAGVSGRSGGILEKARGETRSGGAVGIGTGDAGLSALALVVEAAGPESAVMILDLSAGGGVWDGSA